MDDPLVGAEARLRLGYLHWATGRDEAAQDELAKAAEQAGDADVRYLAQFLLGWIAIARGDSAAAIPRLEAALAARPASQSAALALASLELQRGDADKAHDSRTPRSTSGMRMWIRGACFSTDTIRTGPHASPNSAGGEAMTRLHPRLAIASRPA